MWDPNRDKSSLAGRTGRTREKQQRSSCWVDCCREVSASASRQCECNNIIIRYNNIIIRYNNTIKRYQNAMIRYQKKQERSSCWVDCYREVSASARRQQIDHCVTIVFKNSACRVQLSEYSMLY